MYCWHLCGGYKSDICTVINYAVNITHIHVSLIYAAQEHLTNSRIICPLNMLPRGVSRRSVYIVLIGSVLTRALRYVVGLFGTDSVNYILSYNC